MKNKAIFLDRDGVINEDIRNYTWQISDYTFLPGVFEACRIFIEKKYLLFVITNQGGIAKNLYSHQQVALLHDHMLNSFLKENVKITSVYYCPHHDDFGKCLCRKPGSLMVEKAVARFDIDPAQSFFIGDRDRDIKAGEGAGVKGILVNVNDDLRKVLSQIP